MRKMILLFLLIHFMPGSKTVAFGDAEIKHRFVATDESGKQLIYVDQFNPEKDWTVPLEGNRDIQLSKKGTVLVTVPDGYREYNLKGGELIKEVKAGKGVRSLVRRNDGHTFLASGNGIIELDGKDKQVNSYEFELGRYFRLLRFSRKGNFLFTSGITTVKELKPSGELVRELDIGKITPECKKPYFVEELDNGQFLISAGFGGVLHLVDKDWELIKSFGGKVDDDGIDLHFISDVQLLKNGNIVIAHWTGHRREDSIKAPQLVEYDEDGNVVWTWHDPERAGTLHGIVVIEHEKVSGSAISDLQPKSVSICDTTPNRPNIILIMADDVSWEVFTCYGGQDYKTPNIDKMASEGIRFTNCYSTPICTPSRVKIMTGKYNFRNYTHFGYLNPKEKTFGNFLKEAGYATVIGGKWQLNGLYNPDVFKDCYDQDRPRKFGFDEHCLWQLTKDKEQGERFWDPMLDTNGEITTPADNKGKYGPDIISDFLCDFIERKKNKPFFVYYPTVLVHSPFLPTPDSNGGPYQNRPKAKDKSRKIDSDQQKKNFAAMVEYMDKIVGKLVSKVDQIGELDNTIFIFTADNGTHKQITSRWNGKQIKGGKGNLTDMGTHVPLVAYWKGHTPKCADVDDLIDFTDIYPTLAGAAGIELGDDDPIDGRSFYPRLINQTPKPRQWVLNHYNPYWGSDFKVGQFARDAKYKLYNDGRLYYVPVDLYENNVIKKTSQSDDAAASRKLLEAVLDRCPPAPTEAGKRSSKKRPVYPCVPNLHEPGH